MAVKGTSEEGRQAVLGGWDGAGYTKTNPVKEGGLHLVCVLCIWCQNRL